MNIKMSNEVKIIYLSFILIVGLVLFHNYYPSFYEQYDSIYFVLGLFFLLLFFGSLFYSVATFITDNKPSDLWLVGILGYVGFLGYFLNPLYGLSSLCIFFLFKGNYKSKTILKNILVVIFSLILIATLAYLFYSMSQAKKDEAYYILKDIETKTGLNLKINEKKETFYYKADLIDIKVDGRSFEKRIITNEESDLIRQYFETEGWELTDFKIDPITYAGISDYKKDDQYCIVKIGITLDDEGMPVPEDKLNFELSCGKP